MALHGSHESHGTAYDGPSRLDLRGAEKSRVFLDFHLPRRRKWHHFRCYTFIPPMSVAVLEARAELALAASAL